MMAKRDPESPSAEEAKPFLDHLEELRGTLIACLVALTTGMILSFAFVPQIMALLTAPLYQIEGIPDQFLRSLRVAGAFSVILRIAAWTGLLASMPFIVYFVARFVFPGLTEKEKQVVRRASGFAVGLFFFGVILGYKVCLPVALKLMLWFHDWIGVAAEWTVNDYIAFVVQLLLGFGLAFQLPVIVLVLGKLGIVTNEQLRSKRRHVVILCLVIGMLMTPQDVASQMIMAVPLYLLFELCIWILWLDARKAARAAEEG